MNRYQEWRRTAAAARARNGRRRAGAGKKNPGHRGTVTREERHPLFGTRVDARAVYFAAFQFEMSLNGRFWCQFVM
ncbi:hypothetical protein, partial [Burkholderia multivorans]|uniref:hypothetical protein n=1 Tax=Burkholderia multivorans TaxID=87883 RepID=UPI002B23F8E6